MKFNSKIKTNGKGLWSRKQKLVTCTGLEFIEYDFSNEWAELRVYFDAKTWNVKEDGLIYTDPLFELNLSKKLSSLGLNCKDLSYSEQGMQGDDFVSFDVGTQFIKSAKKLNL